MSNDETLDEYAKHAAAIAPMFETLATTDVLAPIADYLPTEPADIADIGAGTGRDAAWFASQGHRVVAVEPVTELAEYGQAHHDERIEWVGDTLPDLAVLSASSKKFDLILVGSVWHHLDAPTSEAALSTLTDLLKPSGRLVISFKEFSDHDQAGTGLDADGLRDQIRTAGLTLVFETRSDAHQSHNRLAGNTWVWFVIETR